MAHIPVMGHANHILGRIIITKASTNTIRIFGVSFQTIIPNIVENPVGKASTTAFISIRIGTVNHLLNRQINSLLGQVPVLTLNGANSRECVT